jgi:hypothetical protein
MQVFTRGQGTVAPALCAIGASAHMLVGFSQVTGLIVGLFCQRTVPPPLPLVPPLGPSIGPPPGLPLGLGGLAFRAQLTRAKGCPMTMAG